MTIQEIKNELSWKAKKMVIGNDLHKQKDVDFWQESKIDDGVFDVNIYSLEDGTLKACAYDVMDGNTLTDHWLELDIQELPKYDDVKF